MRPLLHLLIQGEITLSNRRVGPRVGPSVVAPLLFMPVSALDARIQGGFRGRADRI